MKKYFAECVGTFVLTFLGCGTAMFLGCGTPAGVVGTAIAFGLAVVAMAYTIGEISGCHINPAITLGVALSGRMSWKDACGYWVGQVIGGILAGAVLLLLTKVVAAPDLTGGLGSNGVANAGGDALKDVWVFICAPLVGGALSACVWKAMVPKEK